MKKNISFIPMDSILSQWLCKKLKQEPPRTPCAGELLAGVQELLNGEAATLMLGAQGGADTFSAAADDGICIGKLSIYPKSRKVMLCGSEVNLTPKEFDILYFLIQNRGEVFTKEQIYRAVWEEDFLLSDSNIMAFIRKLRKKIEPNPDAPEYILTIWGIGYKFNDNL
ncbi:MAG: winged helix-turn-helix domain-containing protein [Lachnospiraceae bacterium]|nr:winged helix-turn-helix domain-containing protein [Lachnospiraceae bacterium]